MKKVALEKKQQRKIEREQNPLKSRSDRPAKYEAKKCLHDTIVKKDKVRKDGSISCW